MRPPLFNLLREEKGFISPLLLMLVLLGLIIMGLVIDLGNAYFQHKRLQNIADLTTIAIGDRAAKDIALRNSDRLEPLIQEMVLRNAELNNFNITPEINVYQNNSDKLFDISVQAPVSTLLMRLFMPAQNYTLTATSTSSYVTADAPLAVIFMYDNSVGCNNTQVNAARASIRQTIQNQMKPGDYVGIIELYGVFVMAIRPIKLIENENEKNTILSYMSRSVSQYNGSGQHNQFAINWGRFDFRRLAETMPQEDFDKLGKTMVIYSELYGGTWTNRTAYDQKLPTYSYESMYTNSASLQQQRGTSFNIYRSVQWIGPFEQGHWEIVWESDWVLTAGITVLTATTSPAYGYEWNYLRRMANDPLYNKSTNYGKTIPPDPPVGKWHMLPGEQVTLENNIKEMRSTGDDRNLKLAK